MRRSGLVVCALGFAFLLGTVASLAENPFEEPPGDMQAKPAKTAREAKPADNPFGSNSAEPKNKAAKRAARSPVRRAGVEAIEAALAKPIDFEYVEIPLKDVIDDLADAMHVEICLDSAALKEAGIDESTPVTKNLHGLRCEKVLRLVLDELQLGWTIHNDVLYITSPARLESDELMETRLYDVADLVVYQDKNGKKFDDFGPLTDIIISTVDTKAWVDNGGNGAILGASLGTAKILVVDHRYEVQKKIAALLAEIRTIAAKKSGGGDLPRRRRPTTTQSGLGMGAPQGIKPPAGKGGGDSSPSPSPPAKK